MVNVVNPINQTAQILPRNFNDASVIQLMLMRKMEYKTPYLFETIRPKKVYEAAKYLANSELYKEEGIMLSENCWDIDANFCPVISQTITKDASKVVGEDSKRIKVLLCASTGVASFNIGGYTLHQAF